MIWIYVIFYMYCVAVFVAILISICGHNMLKYIIGQARIGSGLYLAVR